MLKSADHHFILEVRNIPVSTEDLSLLNEANAKLQTAVVSLTAENRGLQASISRLEKSHVLVTAANS